MKKRANKIFSKKILIPLSAILALLMQNTKVYAVNLDFSLAGSIHDCQANNQDLDQVSCLVKSITAFALDVLGALAFIMILYASIIYLISYGDENKAETAKKTLIWSVIGIIAVSAARMILYIINSEFTKYR